MVDYREENWRAGRVASLGSGLTLANGVLDSTGGSSEWTAGAVSTVGSGLTLASGTLSANAVVQQWTAGTVSAIGAGLAIASNTIAAQWSAGAVSTVGAGLALASGGLSAQWSAGAVSALGTGLTLTSGTLAASGGGSFLPQGNSGTELYLYFDGTNGHVVDYGAGTNTSYATALAAVEAVIGTGTQTKPVNLHFAADFHVIGHLSVSNGWFRIFGNQTTNVHNKSTPQIDWLTIGVSGQTATIMGIMVIGVSFFECDFFNYQPIQWNVFINCPILATGGTGAAGFVADCTLGTAAQEFNWWIGAVPIDHGNATGAGTYPNACLTFLGAPTGAGHWYFGQLQIQVVNTAPTEAFSIIRLGAGANLGTTSFESLDIFNQSSYACTVFACDSGTTAPEIQQCAIGYVRMEMHVTGNVFFGDGGNTGTAKISINVQDLYMEADGTAVSNSLLDNGAMAWAAEGCVMFGMIHGGGTGTNVLGTSSKSIPIAIYATRDVDTTISALATKAL